jgi:hypothetical protein
VVKVEYFSVNPQFLTFCHPERSEGSVFSRQTADPSLRSG